MSQPAVRILQVGQTTSEFDRALRSLNDVDAGRLVVGVSPIVQGVGRLAGDILAALGKDSSIAPYGRTRGVESAWAQDWLVGHAVRRVVFAYADMLPDDVLADITAVVRGAGAEAWWTTWTPVAALNVARALQCPIDAVNPADALQVVTELPPCAPLPVSWPGAFTARVAPPADDPRRPVVVRRLQSAMARGAVSESAVTWLQSAAGPDWRVEVADPRRLSLQYAYLEMRAPADFRWEWLRRLRDTFQAAAMCLAALELSATELVALRASHVASDGSAVAVADDVLPVPPAMRSLLRARLATVRRLHRTGDPLFLADSGVPRTHAHVRTTVCAGFEEMGVLMARLAIEYRIDPAERWLRRHGLTLSYVGPQPTPPPQRLYRRPGRAEPSYTYRGAHKDRMFDRFRRRAPRAAPR